MKRAGRQHEEHGAEQGHAGATGTGSGKAAPAKLREVMNAVRHKRRMLAQTAQEGEEPLAPRLEPHQDSDPAWSPVSRPLRAAVGTALLLVLGACCWLYGYLTGLNPGD